MTDQNPFMAAYDGLLYGLRGWDDLDAFWDVLRRHNDGGWYVYAVGQDVPKRPATPEELATFIDEIDRLLRAEHDEDYCGIVYVDDRQQPGFVKIYDPNNLGAVCGSSGRRVPPGWVLSRVPPVALSDSLPVAGNRRRWWQRLFS